MEKLYYTVKEIAEYFKVSKTHINFLITHGYILQDYNISYKRKRVINSKEFKRIKKVGIPYGIPNKPGKYIILKDGKKEKVYLP